MWKSLWFYKKTDLLSVYLKPVTEDHGHAGCRVCVLPVRHLQRKRLLHFLPEHLVASECAPTPYNPGDPRLVQKLSGHHRGDVGQDSAAESPEHVTQGKVGGGDVGHLTQTQRGVSLPQDSGTHRQVAGFLLQGAGDQLLIQERVSLLQT